VTNLRFLSRDATLGGEAGTLMKPLKANVTLPLLTEPEADQVKVAVRELHRDIAFDFTTDLGSKTARVAIDAQPDTPEEEVDRVALFLRRQQIEDQLAAEIARARQGARK
jgi:hypothetical protein